MTEVMVQLLELPPETASRQAASWAVRWKDGVGFLGDLWWVKSHSCQCEWSAHCLVCSVLTVYKGLADLPDTKVRHVYAE